MKLRFKMLLGFSVLIIILIGIEAYNLLFLQNTNEVITEIVDKKFETDKIVQESNTIVMKIHSDIWDAMLFGKGARDLRVMVAGGCKKKYMLISIYQLKEFR